MVSYSYVLYYLQAYVQQLESSRIKLTQLEQELQRARAQVRLYKTNHQLPLIKYHLSFFIFKLYL